MMNKISQSSDKLENQDSGVTDSLWQPSWWQWLISALSGTVETEKQIAWLKMTREESNRREEDANRREEDANRREEDAKRQHEQRMKELREDSEKYSAIAQQTKKETEQIKKENERLAELESKIEELFSKHGINSNPTKPTDKP
jgi:DNA repair exonuclease SbcCD ATPase subunit